MSRIVANDVAEISKKNKGKVGVNGKNSQSVVIRKQRAVTNPKLPTLDKLNAGVIEE